MTMPLNACGVGQSMGSEGVRPEQMGGPPEEWLPVGPASVRVRRSDTAIRDAARHGRIRWRLEGARMVVAFSDVYTWSRIARSVRRTSNDRRPAWFSHLPGPTAQASAAVLAREVVRLRNEYEAALGIFPEAASGYLVEAEMLLDERARLLRQPGAVCEPAARPEDSAA